MKAIFVCLVVLVLSLCSGEQITGKVDVNKVGFAFLGKFAFDYSECRNKTDDGVCRDVGNHAGQVDLDLIIEKAPSDLVNDTDAQVLFFDDQAESWPTVYKKNLECAEIVNRSKSPTRHFIHWAREDNSVIYDEPPIAINQHVRPRIWYIAIADCNKQLNQVGDIHYTLQMTNIQEASWSMEFGVDQRGLNTLYIFYTFIYVFLVTTQILNIHLLRSTGNLHPMVQLFAISLFLQLFGMICLLIHWVTFTYDGHGIPFLDVFGDVFQIFSQVTFMLLLILIAQGWTITEFAIYHRKQLMIGTCLYAVLNIVALFLKRGLDEASTAYVYNSVPGIMAAVLNFLAGVWFLYSIVQSYRKEQDTHKRSLYTKVGFIFGPWFLALPVEILIAGAVSPWIRDITVTTLTLTITTVAMAIMSFLLWPSRANKYFAITESNIGGEQITERENNYNQL